MNFWLNVQKSNSTENNRSFRVSIRTLLSQFYFAIARSHRKKEYLSQSRSNQNQSQNLTGIHYWQTKRTTQNCPRRKLRRIVQECLNDCILGCETRPPQNGRDPYQKVVKTEIFIFFIISKHITLTKFFHKFIEKICINSSYTFWLNSI